MSVSCFRLESREVRSESVAASWRFFAVSVDIFEIFPEIKNIDINEINTIARAMRMCFPKCVKRFFVVNMVFICLTYLKYNAPGSFRRSDMLKGILSSLSRFVKGSSTSESIGDSCSVFL